MGISLSVVISEKATDGNLPSEDWAANIEICDVINETEEGWVNAKEKSLPQSTYDFSALI